MTENPALDLYLKQRANWEHLLDRVKRGDAGQSDKDDCFQSLSKLWGRMNKDERREVGLKCIAWFH